jgi:hypothetical protein
VGVSKVNRADGTVIMDLTKDTITSGVILKGYTGHNAAGEPITGTCTYDADTSDATASAYDIYNKRTAYVDGALVTGAYKHISVQLHSGSSGCSTTQLVVPCSFEPKGVAVCFNSQVYAENKIISCWAVLGSAICFNSYMTRKLSTSAYEVNQTQITSSVSSYVWYSGGNLYIKAPNSTYTWTNYNYRILVFK